MAWPAVLVLAAAACFPANTSRAVDYTWSGGNGTWSTSDASWLWSGGSVAWPASGTDNDAFFAGISGTVALSGNLNVNAMTFQTAGYLLGGSGTATLNGTAPTLRVDLTSTGTATIGDATSGPVLAGTGGFTKSGAGVLSFAGTARHTITGGITINGGMLAISMNNIASGSNMFDTTNALTLSGGGRLQFGSSAAQRVEQTFNGVTVSGGISSINGLVATGTSILNLGTLAQGDPGGILSVLANGSQLPASGFTNNIRASNSQGWFASWVFSGDPRNTTATSGRWATIDSFGNLRQTSAVGTGSNAISIFTSATSVYNVQTGTLTVNSTVFGLQNTANATLSLDVFTLTTNGLLSITSGSTLTINGSTGAGVVVGSGNVLVVAGAGNVTVGVPISNGTAGNSNLTYAGGGRLLLSATNTYTGITTLNSGTLSLGAVNCLSPSGGLVVNGGLLSYGNNNQSVASLKLVSGTMNAQTGFAGVLSLSGGGSFDLRGGLVNGILGGAAGLSKTTSGMVTLADANTYSGATTISGGTLALASGGGFASSPRIIVGDAGSSGAVLDLTAKTNGFTFLSGQTVGGIGAINIGSGVTVTSNGIWAPGNSIGSNAVTGNLTLSGTSQFELGTPGTSTSAPGTSDFTAVSGTLTLGGALTLLDNAGADGNGSAAGGVYRLFTYGNAVSGSYSSVTTTPTPTTRTSLGNISYGGSGTGSGQGVFLSIYNLASATSSQTINVGNMYAGSTKTASVTLTNSAPNNATYTETLSTGSFSSTSANFSTSGSASGIAGGSSGSGNLLVGLGSGLSAGAVSGTTVLSLFSNAVNSSGLAQQSIGSQTITITGAVWNPAGVNALSPVSLTNVRVGGTFGTSALTITNTAASGSYTEVLGATGSTTGLAGLTGSVSALAGGSTSTAISLGLGGSTNTGSAGVKSGTATLSFTSSGGPGTFVPTAQTVAITGTVYNPASATSLTGTTVVLTNVHVGQSFSTQTLSISNTGAAAAAFQEGLAGSFTSAAGGASGSGSFTNLFTGSASTAISVGLGSASTATAGVRTGTVTLGFTSTGTTSSGATGLSPLTLASQTVAVTGTVFNYAAANSISGTINLGTVLKGTSLSQTLLISNTAPATFSEKLDAAFGTLTGGVTTNAGSVSLLAAGGTSNAMSLYLASGSAGNASGSAQVNFISNGDGTSGLGTTSLGSQTVSLTATVLDPAVASFTSGTAASTTLSLSFGSVNQGDTVAAQNYSLYNLLQTAGFTADLALVSLSETNAGGPLTTNLTTFDSLQPGTFNSWQAFVNTASQGSFTNTWTLQFKSASGTSVYNADTPQTLTLTTSVIVVPEPGAVALAGIGVAATAWLVRRRRTMAHPRT